MSPVATLVAPGVRRPKSPGAGGGGRPAPSFYSEWPTTGATDAAIGDAGKWPYLENHYDTDTRVKTAASAGITGLPSGLNNVLEVDHQKSVAAGGPGPRAASVSLITLPALSVSDTLYGRFYFQNNIADDEGDFSSDVNPHHPVEQAGGNAADAGTDLQINFTAKNDGTYPLLFWLQSESNPKNRWKPSSGSGVWSYLSKFVIQRFEWKLTKQGTNLYTFSPRIYNAAGSLLFDENSFRGNDQTTLLAGIGNLANADAQMQKFRVGTNGGSILVLPNRIEHTYYAGVCFRTDDWCGAWNSTDH